MIAIIAAMTRDHVIGNAGKLPWNLPEDLKLFKQRTNGNAVIMGRRTYESIGKPLPNRVNFVVSSTDQHIPGVTVCQSFGNALALARTVGTDVFVIGGAGVYREALPYADTLYISWVKKEHIGDTFFPHFNEKEWMVTNKEDHGEFEAVTYTRKA